MIVVLEMLNHSLVGVLINFLNCRFEPPKHFIASDSLRPRIWFCLVRKDCAVTNNVDHLVELLQALVCSVRRDATLASLEDYLQPASFSQPPLKLTKRQRMCVESALAKKATCVTVVDISQSAGRVPVGQGFSPCFTTSSTPILCSAGKLRPLTTFEKLWLCGVPASRFRIRGSQDAIKKMVGNSMHVSAVGLAILLAMCCLDWRKSSNRPEALDASSPKRRAKGVIMFKWSKKKKTLSLETEAKGRSKVCKKPARKKASFRPQKAMKARKPKQAKVPFLANQPGKGVDKSSKSRLARLFG